MHSYRFHECSFALGGAKNTDNFVYVYKKYGEWMTDKQIAYGFYFIAHMKLEKTPEFWSVIVPMVKKQLATLDRNCTKSLMKFIQAASEMNLQDNEFWSTVETKLVDEGLHRYLQLDEISDVLGYLANVGRGSDELLEIIEKTVIRHRKALTPQIINQTRIGFQKINKGSEILYRVLEDPTTELPALEA